jgi:pimeloyl-ACP methyl ester carboxylesterase
VDNHFKFLTLPKASGSVANIFIHGYSAGHDLDDRRMLANSIPASLRQRVNVLAFWPSSHFAQLDNRSRSLLMAAVRFHPLAGAAALAGDRAYHFARIRNRAEAMGQVLLAQLDQYLHEHHPDVKRANLIGHSLGGRLLISALKGLDRPLEHGLVIDDVLLMGAAVRVEVDEARVLGQRIAGRLINAWSTDDHVLLLNLGERSLGRMPVEHFDNVCMPGYRHHHYWKRLQEVLVATGFSADPEADNPVRVTSADPVLQDTDLHAVLTRSEPYVLEAAIKHLRSSRWTRLKDSETDRVYAFVREFQWVAGHCLVNAARRRGISYTRVLGMLARQYDLGEALHQCATVVEVEELLLSAFFRHAFPAGHPLVEMPRASVQLMPWDVYAAHIEALAARLTVTAMFKSPEEDTTTGELAAESAPAIVRMTPGRSSGALKGLLGAIRQAPVQRLLTQFGSALRPGYSALIPTVAIIFYARVTLDEDGLM